MNKTKTARGLSINMEAIAKKNERTRAVSNVPVNARGDIIDNRGEIRVTKEQVSKEYYKDNIPGTETKVSIKKDKAKKEIQDPVEINREIREREDGSKYYEIEYSDGSMEEQDV